MAAKTYVGILTAFGFGYLVGGQGGRDGMQEVAKAARAVGASEEFGDLIGAMRAHAGEGLKELGKLLTGESNAPMSIASILDRTKKAAKDD